MARPLSIERLSYFINQPLVFLLFLKPKALMETLWGKKKSFLSSVGSLHLLRLAISVLWWGNFSSTLWHCRCWFPLITAGRACRPPEEPLPGPTNPHLLQPDKTVLPLAHLRIDQRSPPSINRGTTLKAGEGGGIFCTLFALFQLVSW